MGTRVPTSNKDDLTLADTLLNLRKRKATDGGSSHSKARKGSSHSAAASLSPPPNSAAPDLSSVPASSSKPRSEKHKVKKCDAKSFKAKATSKDQSSAASKEKAPMTGNIETYATLPPNKHSAEVFYTAVPPRSHFISDEARTMFCTIIVCKRIVFERPIAFHTMPPAVKEFVEHLGWDKALKSFPSVNRTWVQEFYANFPESAPLEVKLKSGDPIFVMVRGKKLDISPSSIRACLSLPSTETNVMVQIKKYLNEITIQELAQELYEPPPTTVITTPLSPHLSSQFMTEWFKTLGFLVRTMLTPTTQTSKIPHKQAALIRYLIMRPTRPTIPAEYYMYQAIRTAGIPQRASKSCSLVFPGLITKLCLDAGVQVIDSDVMAPEALPIDKITIAKSASQSNVYVEPLEQTLLKQEIRHIISSHISYAVTTLKAALAEQFEALKNELKKSLRTHATSGGPTSENPSNSESLSGSTINEYIDSWDEEESSEKTIGESDDGGYDDDGASM